MPEQSGDELVEAKREIDIMIISTIILAFLLLAVTGILVIETRKNALVQDQQIAKLEQIAAHLYEKQEQRDQQLQVQSDLLKKKEQELLAREQELWGREMRSGINRSALTLLGEP